MRKIAIVGPLDTKGPENLYLKKCIERQGLPVLVIDIRTMEKPGFQPDITCDEVAEAAGTSIQKLIDKNDRSECIRAMGLGAASIAEELVKKGEISGVIAMGGAQTTSMAAEVMRRMPVGFPKVLVSTLATSPHDQTMLSGINDTFVINPLVDVAGLNDVIKMVIQRAATAISGMVKALENDCPPVLEISSDKKCIAISMWGVTTKCVMEVARLFEEKEYQVLVFHATGIGGHTMEMLIRQGVIQGVADLTLAEFANPLVGGEYEYDPIRMTEAAKKKIPWVVVPGGCDMVKHVVSDGIIPEHFKNMMCYLHNPSLLFTRSNKEDNQILGKKIAEKVNKAGETAQVLFPLRGVSAYDISGGPLYNPEADRVLCESLERNLEPSVRFEKVDAHINDPVFARRVFECLSAKLEK